VVAVLAGISLLAVRVLPALAQSPTPDTTATEQEDPGGDQTRSFWGILFAGGISSVLIMLVLFALSIAAVALCVEHIMTIRHSVLMPEGLGEEVRELLRAGNIQAADKACQLRPSFVSFVLRAGMSEVEGGWPAVEKATEDATAEQAARLFRKIEFLSVIANIAPMVGLLGTVMGMIFAFQEVADTQGAARASELAEGIYTALVTTVGGLLVAIPSLAAFAIFRNRVDQLVAEAAYTVQHALAPLKRAPVRRGKPATPSPPPVAGGR